MALSLLFAAYALANALAALANFRAETLIEAWQYQSGQAVLAKQPEFKPAPDELDTALSYSRFAVRVAGYQSRFHRTCGDVLMWQAFLMHGAPDRPALEEAFREFRQAIRLQPSYTVNWVRLSLAKHAAGEIDAEYRDAMANAYLTGRWNPDTLLQLAGVGLADWDRLPQESQAVIRDVVLHRLSWKTGSDLDDREAVNMLIMITESGRRETFCRLLPQDHDRVKTYCESLWGRQATTKPGPGSARAGR